MTQLQRHAVPPPDAAESADRLLVRTIRLAGDAPLDPLAVLAALPAERRHALWRPPAGEADEALVGCGAALRLVVPVGDDPAAAVTALGKRLRRIFGERLERLSGEVRAFFTLAFDPADAFGEARTGSAGAASPRSRRWCPRSWSAAPPRAAAGGRAAPAPRC